MGRDETQWLNYIKWNDLFIREKPYVVIADLNTEVSDNNEPANSFPQTNIEFEYRKPQTISDIRGRENEFDLQRQGFQVCQRPLTLDSVDSEYVDRIYLPQVETLLRETVPNVTKVIVFDWRVRSANPNKNERAKGKKFNVNDFSVFLAPADRVHIDQSEAGTESRIRYHFGDQEAEKLMKMHFQLINVWRPTKATVRDWPLAMCDGSTVSIDEDLLTCDSVRVSFVGESWYPMYRDHYRWYYLNRQSKDEVVLLKQYDSDVDAPARCCPHVAFRHEQVPDNVEPRESIEVRALVFSEW